MMPRRRVSPVMARRFQDQAEALHQSRRIAEKLRSAILEHRRRIYGQRPVEHPDDAALYQSLEITMTE